MREKKMSPELRIEYNNAARKFYEASIKLYEENVDRAIARLQARKRHSVYKEENQKNCKQIQS